MWVWVVVWCGAVRCGGVWWSEVEWVSEWVRHFETTDRPIPHISHDVNIWPPKHVFLVFFSFLDFVEICWTGDWWPLVTLFSMFPHLSLSLSSECFFLISLRLVGSKRLLIPSDTDGWPHFDGDHDTYRNTRVWGLEIPSFGAAPPFSSCAFDELDETIHVKEFGLRYVAGKPLVHRRVHPVIWYGVFLLTQDESSEWGPPFIYVYFVWFCLTLFWRRNRPPKIGFVFFASDWYTSVHKKDGLPDILLPSLFPGVATRGIGSGTSPSTATSSACRDLSRCPVSVEGGFCRLGGGHDAVSGRGATGQREKELMIVQYNSCIQGILNLPIPETYEIYWKCLIQSLQPKVWLDNYPRGYEDIPRQVLHRTWQTWRNWDLPKPPRKVCIL